MIHFKSKADVLDEVRDCQIESFKLDFKLLIFFSKPLDCFLVVGDLGEFLMCFSLVLHGLVLRKSLGILFYGLLVPLGRDLGGFFLKR